MQRAQALVRNLNRSKHFPNHFPNRGQIATIKPPCDVFINHRGIDTKRNVAGLLFHYLNVLNVRPFLDSQNMKPGDRLFHHIDNAILGCKVGIAVFSPRYCESMYCLHELALLMGAKKRVIPIFCDIKPYQLKVIDNGQCSAEDLQRYSHAIEEARNTVGITFDSLKGDWSELLKKTSDAVITNLIEDDEEWPIMNPSYIVNKNNNNNNNNNNQYQSIPPRPFSRF